MPDYHNPLSVTIPHEFPNHQELPTEIVAQRFQAYRDIVKDLISYLRQYASVQEEIVRQQVRLQQAVGAPSLSLSGTVSGEKHGAQASTRTREKHAINDDELSAINQFFLPIGNGSLQDIPTILTKFHQQNIQNGTKTLKEITQVIIPKLEDLRKDLLVKVKEIKNLQNDFKNTLTREMNETRLLMAVFSQSIDVANHLEIMGSSPSLHHDVGSDMETSKKDPFLVKLRLERQLKRQLYEEAYLYEAYKNLQASSEKLESIVVLEIQNNMGMFLGLVENESLSVPNFLVPNFSNGFLAKEPNMEWDAFILRNLPHLSSISHHLTSGTFIDLSFPTRKISDLAIPHYDSLLNVPVKEGTLERRSKFLKSYSGGWYVLTCSYLHEFKSADRKKDLQPVMSLSLDHCLVSEHSKNDGKMSGAYKFVLYSKLPNGLIHRGHNWSFRCDNYQTMVEWYNDIKTLTSLASPSARAKAMSKQLAANNAASSAASNKLSRTSSGVSAHSGVRSLRSTTSNPSHPSHIRNRLSQQMTNISAVSAAVSRRSLSQTKHRSPKLLNLINSDGTAVASLDDHGRDADSVDHNGNTTVRTLISMDGDASRKEAEAATGHASPALRKNGPSKIDLLGSNYQAQADQVSAGGQASPQTIPQNYQYYLNQVNLTPQQFYDPVTQQFFMINAIPALQVALMEQVQQVQQVQQAQQAYQQNSVPATTTQGAAASLSVPQQTNAQPMPQYFPSSPIPMPSLQLAPPSPNIHPQMGQTSPLLPQGQFLTYASDGGKRLSQNIPHFPSYFTEAPGVVKTGSAPMQLGESLEASVASPVSLQPGHQADTHKHNIEDRVSRLTVTDEN